MVQRSVRPGRVGRVPAAATAAGTDPEELSCDGRPGVRQDIRIPHLGAALPVDAYSLAVSCGGRGVSLDIWPASLPAPAAPRVACLPRHDRDRSRSRATLRATTWSPQKRRTFRPAARLSRAGVALLAVGVCPRPRATANVAYGALAMRRPPTAAQSQRRHMGRPTAPFSPRRTVRSGNATSKAAT